jgi:hypothetical protein
VDRVLDQEQIADSGPREVRFFRMEVPGIVEVGPALAPAAAGLQALFSDNLVELGPAIDQKQVSLKLCEHLGGVLALCGRREAVEYPFLVGERPHSALPKVAIFAVFYRISCVVALQVRARQQVRPDGLGHTAEQFRALFEPRSEGVGADDKALALHAVGLAVQRKVIVDLVDEDACEKRLSTQRAVERVRTGCREAPSRTQVSFEAWHTTGDSASH